MNKKIASFVSLYMRFNSYGTRKITHLDMHFFLAHSSNGENDNLKINVIFVVVFYFRLKNVASELQLLLWNFFLLLRISTRTTPKYKKAV